MDSALNGGFAAGPPTLKYGVRNSCHPPMTTVYDVPPDQLIHHVASELEDDDAVQPPEWAPFVKTAASRERPPEEDGWWFIRTASVLRKVYTKGPVGTERLRREYGGPKNNGSAPAHGARGSGSIVRNALQQLEEAGYVKTLKGKGRTVTPEGRSFLDDAAHEIEEQATA